MERRKVQHISDHLSLPGQANERNPRLIEEEELKARVRTCGRLLAAWPNARPASVDLTLLEYVNATRGVTLRELSDLISSCIQAGGEFIPPAGEIIGRVVKLTTARAFTYNAHISGEQRALESQERQRIEARAASRGVELVLLEEVQRLAIGSGTRSTPALPEWTER